MAAKKRILFITQELTPYMGDTPQGENARNFSSTLQRCGGEVRIFLPRYGTINERRNQLHEVIRLSGLNIPISDADHPLIIKVASLPPYRIQVYFIDNDDYFERDENDIDEVGSNRLDNDERIIFFTRGTLETARKLGWDPDIIRCSGWMAALMPVFIRKIYGDEPSFKKAKIVYVIDDTTFTTPIQAGFADKVKAEGVRENEVKLIRSEEVTLTMLQALAIKHADAVVVRTPNAAPEVLEILRKGKKPWLPYEKVVDPTGEPLLAFYNSL